MPEERRVESKKIENIKLKEFHCIECGALLGKFNLIIGEVILEIKCDCNTYNTMYLKKTIDK